MVVDEVIVRLKAQVEQYKRDLAAADTAWSNTVRNIQSGTAAAQAASARLGVAMAGALSVGAVIALGAAFIGLADKAKSLEAQLRLATAGFGSFAQAQADVRRIALETRSPLEETARLYATLMRSANELGITQSEAARATETISKAFKISGADAVSAAQGTRQLIQAIQSGTLRGDEFNTMMESAPRLARLFADGLKVPVTHLRGLAEQGKITAQTLLDALSKPEFTKALDEEFKRLPMTFDQAMTNVKNAALITFSAFDRGGEFSKMLSEFVAGAGDDFAAVEDRAERMGVEFRATISGLYNVFDPIGDNAINVMSLIEGEIRGLQMLIQNLLNSLQNAMNVVVETGNTWKDRARFWTGGLIDQAPTQRFNFANRFGQTVNRTRIDRGFALIAGRGLSAIEWPGSDPRGNRADPLQKTKKGTKKKGEDAAAKALREAQRREREEEAFARELESLNDELLSAKAALATASDDIYQYKLQEIEAERQNALASIERESTGVNRKYTEAQAEELRLKHEAIAAAKRDKLALDRRAKESEDAYNIAIAEKQGEIELRQASADFLLTREAQRDAALALLDLQFELRTLELEAIKAKHVQTDAEWQIADEALKRLDALKQMGRRAINQQHRSPGQQYLAELQGQAMNLNDELENLAVDKVRELASTFGQAATAALGLKGAIGDIVAKLIEMAFQQAVILPLMRAIFSGGSLFGGGNILNTAVGQSALAIGAPRASGGPVKAGHAYWVGENGPEPFIPATNGTIVSNETARTMLAGGGGNGMVEVHIVGGEYFDARVASVSGPVAARVVAATAPRVADVSMAKTVSQMGRPHL